MVELGDDNVLPGTPTSPESPGKMKGQRRHVRTERDLARRGAEEIGQSGAGSGNELVGLFAGRIGPMGVGVVMVEILHHGLHDRPRDLSPSGAVEVGDGITAMLAQERRKR